MAPLISIVIVTFQAEKFLPKTLESIRQQEGRALDDVEILLVDGQSTDDTVSLARGSGLPIQIMVGPDDGIYDAMNKGARAAKGRWLHFLNAGDAFADAEALLRVIACCRSAEQSGHRWVVGGAKNLKGGHGDPIRVPNLPHSWLRHALGIQPHCHQATWFDREAFFTLNGYSLRYSTASDFDLILRMGLAGPPEVCESVVIDYLGGGVSERQHRNIPRLLNRIRTDRFQLSAGQSRIDLAVAELIWSVNFLRMRLGRIVHGHASFASAGRTLAR